MFRFNPSAETQLKVDASPLATVILQVSESCTPCQSMAPKAAPQPWDSLPCQTNHGRSYNWFMRVILDRGKFTGMWRCVHTMARSGYFENNNICGNKQTLDHNSSLENSKHSLKIVGYTSQSHDTGNKPTRKWSYLTVHLGAHGGNGRTGAKNCAFFS